MNEIEIRGWKADTPALSAELAGLTRAAVQEAIRTDPKPPPDFRIAADLTFSAELDDGSRRTFELIADGKYLRDPTTHVLWPFPLGRRVLEEVALRQGFSDDSADTDAD